MKLVLAIAGPILLAGCASVGASCPGGALRLAQGSVQELGAEQSTPLILAARPTDEVACLASAGNKYAQFALGHAYEHGVGVAPDRDAALQFYAMAAADVIGSRQIYSAPVGSESTGTVISIPGQVLERGLPEARASVARLRGE